ncbi:sugar phosphate nucleotidyltransferase [Rhodospirillales bacterium]|nr:sugar phosphate nucleotidyltransferase [Rhodospirillales bacterium]
MVRQMQTYCLQNIDVIILAGGLGTRLSPVLNGKPKLLAPICGEPYIEFILKWLLSFGVRRIILALGYLASDVEEYLKSNQKDGIEIVCSVEPEPLGTAGGLAKASDYIQGTLALVMNGDSFVDADLCKLIDLHKSSASDATIICTRIANSRHYGSVKITEDGIVTSFEEKPSVNSSNLINAGIYAVNGKLIQRVKGVKSGSLERDVFQQIPLGGLNAISGKFDFLDIGTPEDYNRADVFFQPFIRRWEAAKK